MEKKPNLLYIFADQWRAHAVGYQNQDEVQTPCIDRFAEESMRFSNAISTFPLCSPHRASLLTGKYPFSAGMWTNCKTGLNEVVMLKPQETCIANVLKEQGYETGYIGKWHLDASEMNFTQHPESGASDWDAYTPPGERRQGFDYWLSYGACDDHLDPHYWADSDEQIRPHQWSPEFETDQALAYMGEKSAKDEPFALFLSYNPPHLPYELVPDDYFRLFKDAEVRFRDNVPEEFRTDRMKVITRQYFAAIAGIDHQFGRIYQYLKDNNLEEDTIVVLSADHGDMMGSHGLMSKNVWYEESINIPLMIRQKGRIEPGDRDAIFTSPDHMPTLLDLLGIQIPETCQGHSHGNLIMGLPSDEPEAGFICSFPGEAQMVKEYEKRGMNHKCFGWRGVRTKEHTYVVYNGYRPDEERKILLYHNAEDPYQQNPVEVADVERDELAGRFHGYLKKYLELTGDPFLLDR